MLGLRTKVLLIVAGVVLVALLANALTSSYFYSRQQTESHIRLAHAISRILAGQLERILFLGITVDDLQGFERQCAEAVSRNSNISHAFVVSQKGEMLFHSVQADGSPMPMVPPLILDAIRKGQHTLNDRQARSHAVIEPVLDPRGVRVADVVVGFPQQVIDDARARMLLVTSSIDMAIYLASLIILFFALSYFVIRPLSRIVGALETIEPGNLGNTLKLPETGRDELGIMVRAFNRLLARLTEHEQALVRAKDSAERANRAKSEFLAVMSHEIRTPMHAVLGMSELMLRSPLNDQQSGYAIRIRRAGRALLAVINDILDFSKIEAGRIELEQVDFDLQTVIDDALDTISSSAAEKGLSLDCQRPEGPIALRGDPVRVMQVLMNLLGNAVKFTQRGGISLTLEVEPPAPQDPESDARLVRIQIADTGIGIAPEAGERILEPFSQADNSITRKYGGSGLGLAIVKRMLKLMRGEMAIFSKEGEGATFDLRIPFQSAESLLCRAPRVSMETSLEAVNAQVLLAEDDPVNQEVARAMLEDSGCVLTLVSDGESAVQVARQRHFELIFMDCHMPVRDGFSATRRIRSSDGPCALTPVLALTADVSRQTRDDCREAGMDDYLAKPFSQADLDRMLGRWLGKRHAAGTRPSFSPHPAAPDATAEILDVAFLERIASLKHAREKQLLRRTLELYQQETPKLMDVMDQAIEREDFSALAGAVHRLKSSSAHVGATRASELARDIEAAALGAAGRDQIPALRVQLGSAIQVTLDAVEHYLGELPA